LISRPTLELDERDLAQLVKELLARGPGYVPEWKPSDRGPDAALVWIFCRYLSAVIQRLNQAPEKNKLAFLDLLGLSLTPAQAARAPVVFQVAPDSTDSQVPVNTQVAAPPPQGSPDQIIFETERAVGIAAARLKEVVSLWPGRDQYLDHSKPFLAGESFQLFRKPLLQNTPHEIYIAHDTLLALAGSVMLEVEFELMQTSSEPLTVSWQYWDGKVWRGFKSARPGCSEKWAAQADSTGGLTRSGRFLLETDCAESSRTTVNATEAFWIRGQLVEPLPPDPSKALPLVESVRLKTIINQSLKGILQPLIESNEPRDDQPPQTLIRGGLMNEAGQPLQGVAVKISSPDDLSFEQEVFKTDAEGHYNYDDADKKVDSVPLPSQSSYQIQASFLNLEASCRLAGLDENRNLKVNLTFNVAGLDADNAFADAAKLDVTKPFYPFGQQPQPGSTFYFNQEEVFSKPGALVQIYVARTASAQDTIEPPKSASVGSNPNSLTISNQPAQDKLEHLIDWEYYNGRKWVTFLQSSSTNEPVADLDTTEVVEFTIPPDMVKTTVNDQEGLWMRARLVSGSFGFMQTVTWFDDRLQGNDKTNEITYPVYQPPCLAAFRIGYTWQHGPFAPENVQTYNDFVYTDCTYESIWPGNAFLLFSHVRDTTPTLYLGFDGRLPVDSIGLFFDIVEKAGEVRGPAMLWEYFDGFQWRELAVADETQGLRLPGIFSFIAAEDSQPLARFDTSLHWVRGRLKEDGPPGEPSISGIFTNAVWASQQQTYTDVPLGASSGLPGQVFLYTQIPVLAGERIEVRELAGPRANTEWRVLVTELKGGDAGTVLDFEEMLGRESLQSDFVKGDIRLRRDRNKKVAEVWVRWQEKINLLRSGPDDRNYTIDRARGLVFFGDGVKGKIPPPGTLVHSKQHRAGGGEFGNVPPRAINQLLGPAPGVQSLFNPIAAEGGADGERVESLSLRGPQSVRHRGRAVLPADYETLAHEASPDVAVARVIALRSESGRSLPGWLTLLIIPQNGEARPVPSFGLREQVRKYIERVAPAGAVAAGQIYITGPDYLSIDVRATIAPVDPSKAGAVEKGAREALEEFLHPLRGGPERRGWELGRDVYLSDITAVLERVEGVDYVRELELLVEGNLRGERVMVADNRIVAAGEIRLTLTAAEA
jgi:uncharacterized phage protein gp47/JayE